MENFDINDLIEGYLDGSLSPDEKKAVEARMAADPAFLAEVDLHRRLQKEFADPQKLQLRDLMSDILRETPVPPEATSLNWLKILGIALAVLLGAWAIWQISWPRQKNTSTPPTRQEEHIPQNQPIAGKDSLANRAAQAPRGPIAMADKVAFKSNPMFEARVGNGGIRSTDDQVVEIKRPALGADFTPENGRVQIKFSGERPGGWRHSGTPFIAENICQPICRKTHFAIFASYREPR